MNVDVNKLVDQMRDILGPIAMKGYGLAVRQAYIEGWWNLGVSIVLILLALASGFVSIKCLFSAESDGDEGPIIAFLVFGAISLVCVVIAIVAGNTAYNDLMNPGWRAVQIILNR